MFSVAIKRTTTCTPRSSAALIRRGGGGVQTRFFTPLAIYSRFPASFYYYRNKPKSSIFDRAEIDQYPPYMAAEAVDVAPNRLVYPKAIRAVCNGITLLADTIRTEELIRNYYDKFIEYHKVSGQQQDVSEVPVIYSITQTTQIPEDLILVFKNPRWYTLQPSHGMQLRDLNNYMDEFFEEYATKETVKSWLSDRTIAPQELDPGSEGAQPLLDYKQVPFQSGRRKEMDKGLSKKLDDIVARKTNDVVQSANDEDLLKEVKRRFPMLLGPSKSDGAASRETRNAVPTHFDGAAVVCESDEEPLSNYLESDISRETSNAVLGVYNDAGSKKLNDAVPRESDDAGSSENTKTSDETEKS